MSEEEPPRPPEELVNTPQKKSDEEAELPKKKRSVGSVVLNVLLLFFVVVIMLAIVFPETPKETTEEVLVEEIQEVPIDTETEKEPVSSMVFTSQIETLQESTEGFVSVIGYLIETYSDLDSKTGMYQKYLEDEAGNRILLQNVKNIYLDYFMQDYRSNSLYNVTGRLVNFDDTYELTVRKIEKVKT